MLQTAILVLATLSGSTTQNAAMISNSNNAVTHAKQEISQMKKTFLKNHKFSTKLLSNDLNTIYNFKNDQKSNLLNLKDGRNGHKWHWYGIDVWINEALGSKMNRAIASGDGIAAVAGLLCIALDTGPAAPIVITIAALLMAEWEITWSNTDEGWGIHVSIELITGTPYIVYAHAQ